MNVNTAQEEARKINSGGSEFKVPNAPRDELQRMARDEWMSKYGDVLASEQYFEKKDPNWNRNPQSWWYREAGRAGPEVPLWLRKSWHIPELDHLSQGDRHGVPVGERSEKPLWAERMYLEDGKSNSQSTTIYGHRKEYLPAQKSDARSMYERYQPSYHRVSNDELPDTADPPDGRYWTAGVAQGVTTNPYEKRIAISGRRKPIVIGPRSISVVVDGEGHSLANAVREVSWLHPHVEFAGYSLEHPVYRHVNFRVQTKQDSGVGGEQALAESLELTKEIYSAIGAAFERSQSR